MKELLAVGEYYWYFIWRLGLMAASIAVPVVFILGLVRISS